MSKSRVRRFVLYFVITGILLVSFVVAPLSTLVQSAVAQPADILGPKWVRYGMGSTASSVLISDVRDDIPGEEVIVVGVNYVRALDGRENTTGYTNTLWQRFLPEVWYWAQPQMADLNLDGIAEVIVPFGNWPLGGNGLYILHGNNGSTYWEIRGLGGNSIASSLVIGDIDGDGYPTIFVASEDVTRELEGTARLTAISHDGEILHQTFVWRACAGGLSLADGDNDGVFELYMGDRHMYQGDGSWGKGVRSFWAENLTVRWNHPDILCSSQAPPLADVNGDGILDVIVSNQRGGVLVLDSRTGSAIRKDVSRRDLPTHYQGSVYDIDGDGNLEILFADGDHSSTPDDIAVFDLVEWQVDGRIDVGLNHYGPQVADVTGDGNMEIIATSFNGIHIIDPQTYTVIDEVTGLGGEGEKLQNAVVQDIDGDGLVEIVVSSETGTVRAYDTAGLSPQARGLPRARSEVQFYSERRLGAAEYVPPPGQTPEPIISNLFPSHKAVNVPVSLSELNFTLKDYQDNKMNYTVVTSPNIGSPSGTGVISGTEVSVSISSPLDYSTGYIWEVKVTDGTDWTNRTFSFRTEFEPGSNLSPTHDDPLLEGGAETTEDDLVSYNQTTIDKDGDEVTNIYNWYRNNVSLTNLLLPFDMRSATTAKDYSGYSNDATIRGATWTSDGVVGGAYEFHGDDYIMIPHSSSLGGDGTWSEISVEHWIYFSQDQDGTRTISKIPSYEIGFQTGSNNRIFAGVWTNRVNDEGDPYLQYRGTSSYGLSTNTWYHVVMTYNDGEGVILYVNGIARRSRSHSGTIKASAGSRPETREPVYLGWFDFFEGKIDEVRIYPKALSPEQIYQRYSETKDGLSSNSTLVSEETISHSAYKCEVTPNDGLTDGIAKFSNITSLVNLPPVASNLRFPQRTRSEFALTTENLVAAYDYYDADGDPDNGTEIRWYKDGVIQGAYNDTLSVDSTATSADEDWNFTVRPSDGEDFGTLQTSLSVLIIENDPPSHDNPLLVSSGGTNRTDEDLIGYNQTTADPDGDQVTNIYHWYINDTSMTNLLLPFDTDDAMTAKDYSGYGNDGAISGTTWTSDGIVGGAYLFDGDDVITVEDDASLGGYGTWSEISVEFWVKTAAPLHGTRIVARKVGSASTGSYMVGFQTSTGDPANTVFWGIESAVDGDWYDIWDTTTTVLETGEWSHIICTYESGPGLTIYINGMQSVNLPVTGNIDYDPDEQLFLGYDGGGTSNRYLTGTLDEVRIYPVALTSAQIFQRYMETKDGLSNSSTIVPQETTPGEVWSCEVIPNDSWQDGTAKTSNTLTVLEAGAKTLIPLSGWSVDARYTNADYVLSSTVSSLSLELQATDVNSRVTIRHLNVPKLALSEYDYVDMEVSGSSNARILLRFFLDDGSSFNVAYWKDPDTLNATAFDLSAYSGRTLRGDVYIGLMSSDGLTSSVAITEIAFVIAGEPQPLIPLSGWSVDARYTNAPYVLSSTESSLSLELQATDTNSKVTIRHLNVPQLNLSDFDYVDVEADGSVNARILLRFFLDDGSSFNVAYWKDPDTLNATAFDLSAYSGRTLRGDVYIGLMSSDGLTSSVAITEIAFVVSGEPEPLIPLSGWSVDSRYTNAPYVLSSTESSLSLQLDATDTSSKVTIRHLDVPKLNLTNYDYVDVTVSGSANARILMRFFLDDGSSFDVVYWKDPDTLNATAYDLSPYAGRTLRGDVYIGLMSSDGTTSNIEITEIVFVDA